MAALGGREGGWGLGRCFLRAREQTHFFPRSLVSGYSDSWPPENGGSPSLAPPSRRAPPRRGPSAGGGRTLTGVVRWPSGGLPAPAWPRLASPGLALAGSDSGWDGGMAWQAPVRHGQGQWPGPGPCSPVQSVWPVDGTRCGRLPYCCWPASWVWPAYWRWAEPRRRLH